MINWDVRWKNKTFWLTIIPAILLLVQAVANLFGFKLEMSDLQEKLLVVVNAVFGVLVILGVAGMGAAVFADTGVALIVVLNGMRLMHKSKLSW